MIARRALVMGEALVDEFPDRRVVAGAPLHVAVHLASLGWHTSMLTRVGDDHDGQEIVDVLERFGVDTSLIQVDRELPTGVTKIEMSGTDHTFDVVHPAAWDFLEAPDALPPVDVVGFGTLALRDVRTAGAVADVTRKADATVVVDLNLREPHYDDDAIRTAVTRADVLKLNEDEFPQASRAFEVDAGFEPLHEQGPRWICVTRGAAGAELSRADGAHWTAQAPSIEVVDTVGAGDAFFAVLIDGLLTGRDPHDVLVAAARRGAEIAAQRGGLPDPP